MSRFFLPRRALLGASALSSLGFLLQSQSVWGEQAPQVATTPPNPPVLLCVFLRGAADGLSLVVPHADANYYELRRNRMRKVRWFNWLSGDRFHRVVLPVESYPLRDHLGNVLKIVRSAKPQECWTLFVHGRKAKQWGFLRPAWDRGDRPGEVHGYTYVVHRDQDNSADSDAWARSAPKGRELRQ